MKMLLIKTNKGGLPMMRKTGILYLVIAVMVATVLIGTCAFAGQAEVPEQVSDERSIVQDQGDPGTMEADALSTSGFSLFPGLYTLASVAASSLLLMSALPRICPPRSLPP